MLTWSIRLKSDCLELELTTRTSPTDEDLRERNPRSEVSFLIVLRLSQGSRRKPEESEFGHVMRQNDDKWNLIFITFSHLYHLNYFDYKLQDILFSINVFGLDERVVLILSFFFFKYKILCKVGRTSHSTCTDVYLYSSPLDAQTHLYRGFIEI